MLSILQTKVLRRRTSLSLLPDCPQGLPRLTREIPSQARLTDGEKLVDNDTRAATRDGLSGVYRHAPYPQGFPADES